MNFNLKKTPLYLAIQWEYFPLFKFAKALKKLFCLLFIVVFLLFLYGFLPETFPKRTNQILFGLSIISLEFTLFFGVIESFVNSKLKQPKVRISLKEVILDPEQYNLAEFLSFEVAKAVYKSLKFTNFRQIDSNHLLYFLLADDPKLNFIFYRALLDIKETKEKLKKTIKEVSTSKETDLFTESFQRVILESLKRAQEADRQVIEIGDVISALAKYDSVFQEILLMSKLKPEDIENLVRWLEKVQDMTLKSKRFWEYENLAKGGTLAKEWTAGYTITLDKFSTDLTNQIKGSTPEFVVHKEQVKIVERVLARREINNVLIIGEPGSGRRGIVYGLAQKGLLGKSLAEVNYKRVVQLDMPALLAQIQDVERLEVILDRIFLEVVTAGNVILVIDEFHNYMGEAAKPGVVDIAGILIPYLRIPNFQIICITNYEGFHRNIEKNPSALSLFEKVEVPEVTEEETLLVLEGLVPVLEKKYKVFISYPALRHIVFLTGKYLPAFSFPEKAIKVLDEVAVYAATTTKEKVILPKHVERIITEKTEIPVGEMAAKEKQTLLNLEDLIHQRIINQDEAVREVSTAMRRTRSGVTIRKGPIGCFLFLGPTGVGKTETSKALAEFYFGSETRMIRLDMSEFQDIKDIARLIGSPTEVGLLVASLRENPFSLLLLDEIEKSHPNILNLFLQVLDEGYLTDGLGKKADFKNTIIIATSNAGYQIILEAIKQQTEWSGVKQKLLDYLFAEKIFRPEFINRFDAVVVFRPLTKENLFAIAELMLRALKKNLKEKGIELIITEPLKEKIAELGYNPIFGAREMRRVVQDKIENVLAPALLSGQLVRGNSVTVDPDSFKLIINPKNQNHKKVDLTT